MSLFWLVYCIFSPPPRFLFFYRLPALPSFHPLPSLRLMHLTNHWARKGINSYSKQRAIMGTLVVRKLRIFKPARRFAGKQNTSTHCFLNTLLAKPEKEEAGETSTGKTTQGEAKGGVCSLDARVEAPASETASPQRPNHQMTRWSSLQWQTDNETVLCSFKHTMGSQTMCVHTVFFFSYLFILYVCINTHTRTQACVSMLVFTSLCI